MTARSQSILLLKDLIRQLGWRFRAYVPFSMAISALFLLPPQLLRVFTEGVTSLERASAEDLIAQIGLFGLIVAVCVWVAVFFSNLASEWLRLGVSLRLRAGVMSSLHNTRLEALDGAARGEWLTRMTSDLRSVEGFLSESIPEQLRQAVILVGSGILFGLSSGAIALLLCAFAILVAVTNVWIQRRMAPELREARELEGDVFQGMIESFEGIRTIRNLKVEDHVEARFQQGLEAVRRVGMRIIRRMGALMGGNEFASQLVITGCLCLIGWKWTDGDLTVEDVLVYPFFLTLFLNAAKSLFSSAYEWNRFFVEGSRLAEILQPAPRTTNREVTTDRQIRGLEIGYDGNRILGPLDLELQPGQIQLVLGPSGSGKSTLLEVLAGLRDPLAGSTLPDQAAALVEQRPWLFAGSIRDNLSPGLQLADETLQNALDQAGLLDELAPRGGLDAMVADRAQNLSEGQRYRLGLARAILTQRPFLLLDEPFAALDPRSVQHVVETIQDLAEAGTGVIVATHQVPEGLQQESRLVL